MSLDIKPDVVSVEQIGRMLAALPDKVALVERDALNRASEHGKSVAASEGAEFMTAKRASVAKRILRFKATIRNLSSAIVVKGGRGLNLAGFSPRQTKGGVTVKIFGQRQAVPDSFLTTGLAPKNKGNFEFQTPVGNALVAKREGQRQIMKKGQYAGRVIRRGPRAGQPVLRQPIVGQVGPSVAETFEKVPQLQEDTQRAMGVALEKAIDQQIDRRLEEAARA